MKPFITMDDYEKMYEEVEEIHMEPVFYSIEDIKDYIEPDIKTNLPFAMRLSQQMPTTPYEKKARSYLLDLLNQTIIFDEEDN